MPGKREILLAVALGIAFTAVWAIKAGKGVSWDEKNYHHYNVYAWLTGRMDYHVAPAGMHSWLNPIVYVPQYWLVNHAPPVVAGTIFGAWVGLNFVLIYALARLVLLGCTPRLAMGLAFASGAVGFYDPSLLGMIGTTDADNVVNLPVLGSLCAVCWAGCPGKSKKEQNLAYGLAGILLGAAAGLKWTCFVYALGTTVTLVVLWPLLRMNLSRFLWFAAGGVLGYLPAGGYWNWVLWTKYHNPFFPYWNDAFRSPWAVPESYRDVRFLPPSVEAAITYPFQWFIGVPPNEGPFRDARFALLSVLIPLAAAVLIGQWIAQRWTHRDESTETTLAARERLWFLLTFFVASYALWITLFSIQRYLAPLALVSGLLLLLALDWLIPSRVSKLSAFFLLAIFCVFWVQVEPSSWRLPYGSSWFGVELVSEVKAPDTLFIMLGDGPMGYVVPYLPESSRTVRLIGVTIPESETVLVRRAREIISQHAGPMRSLAMVPLTETDFSYLGRFGLALEEESCVKFHSQADQFTSCRVIRQAEASHTGQASGG